MSRAGAAAIPNAASALLRGWRDPMHFLSLGGTERLIADRVVEAAGKQHWEEMEAFAKAIGYHVAAQVSQLFAR